jgi:single-strand DNA-binding protein
MRGINKAIILGTVGKDPDVRGTQSGSVIASFSLATNEKFKDKAGKPQERTEWHNITVFGRLAEIVQQYVRKGMPLYIEGALRTEQWQDKEGNTRYTTKIIANELQMLGSKEQGNPTTQSAKRPTEASRGSRQHSQDEFEDDVPF